MTSKLVRLDGKSLNFQLSDNEEKVLQLIYHTAKTQSILESGNFAIQNVLLTGTRGAEMVGIKPYKLSNILKRLEQLNLIRIRYYRSKTDPFKKYRYAGINLNFFDKNYGWSVQND